jgi:hypothetical protein
MEGRYNYKVTIYDNIPEFGRWSRIKPRKILVTAFGALTRIRTEQVLREYKPESLRLDLTKSVAIPV